MTHSIARVRIEKSLANKAKKQASSLGLSISDIITRYLQKFISEREITFKEYCK